MAKVDLLGTPVNKVFRFGTELVVINLARRNLGFEFCVTPEVIVEVDEKKVSATVNEIFAGRLWDDGPILSVRPQSRINEKTTKA